MSTTLAQPAASDWPRWRGAAGDAVASGAKLPETLPAEPKVIWETKLGGGWSSPIVGQGKLFITDRMANSERTLAMSASTGEVQWAREHTVDFDPHAVGRRHGNGPKSTPLFDRGRVFSLGIAGWLEALDAATGRSLWQVDLPAEYGERSELPDGRAFVDGERCVIVPVGSGQGAPVPLFGYTGSLTLHDQKLIVPVGGVHGGTVHAFDASSGRLLWKALDEHVSYSSLVVATIGGVEQVVAMTGPRVVGLALADGRLLWSHPFQVQYDESIGTPVIVGERVFVQGDGHPLTALEIATERSGGGVTQRATVAWENDDLSSYLSSMVARDGYLYGMNDGGRFTCLRVADGKTMWSDGQLGYYCSPILCGERLLGLNERGQLSLVGADPAGFRLFGQCRAITSQTWTMPALVGGRVFVRGAQSVRCIEF